jgi:hypothetical protein
MLGFVVVGISMYGCESFATSFQFFLLAFQIVVSFPHQWYDTTTTTPPSLCAPHDPSPSRPKPFFFTLFFQKEFAVFTANETTTTTLFSSLGPQRQVRTMALFDNR